jgi:hypothetical protein
MLALRNIICSDRGKEEWPKIEDKLRLQARHRREQLHQSRITVPPPSIPEGRVPNLDVALIPSLSAQIEQKDCLKKPKKNPWRNFKCGKALYQRPVSPKI